MTRISLLSLLAVAAVALVIAGCGGGGGDQATAASPSTSSSGGSPTLSVADTSLGKVLVNSDGRTVYDFGKDTGSKSMCTGGCAGEWPPVTTSGKPTVGSGLTKSMVGTTRRSDGKTQVTYNGHPLYTFAGDSKAGDTNGQGLDDFGGIWWALSPSGADVTAMGSGSSSGSGNPY
jgi:predicted lipoprotein with Yx(FWY)xxD motif